MSDALFAPPLTRVTTRADGDLVMESASPLGAHPTTVLHSLDAWAAADPGATLAAERDGAGTWRHLTYGDAAAASWAVGQGLLDLGLGADRPLVILSGNSLDHLTLMLAGLRAGVPVAPVSVAYSTLSKDHERLREISQIVAPGAVFAEDSELFAAAFEAMGGQDRIVSRGVGDLQLAQLARTDPGPEVERAFEEVDGDAVAKLLFTSGSTGTPKAVITTHRMLAANQQMMRQVWPFLATERPVILDWLPWSHTFGGSHNVNLVLVNGGSLFIDGGRPAPALFGQTLANLAEVSPTIYFNVPAGYAQLVPALENDPDLAAAFFSRLRLVFNAAAALPANLRERLVALGERTTGNTVPVTGSWGLTETAPAVTSAHFAFTDARSIGVPLAGACLRLRPVEGGYEIRVRGPMVTPGYLNRPDLTADAFDEEGFYRTGDAVHFADPEVPDLGLVFRGRLAEDFKLTTGTFVHVGAVRTSLLSAVPLLTDAVITGHDRDEVCALGWLNAPEAEKALGRAPAVDGDVYDDPDLGRLLARSLGEHAAGKGTSYRVERLLVMTAPADLDAGEITDKGYINQGRVLANRAGLVDLLYTPDATGVVTKEDAP